MGIIEILENYMRQGLEIVEWSTDRDYLYITYLDGAEENSVEHSNPTSQSLGETVYYVEQEEEDIPFPGLYSIPTNLRSLDDEDPPF